MPKIETQGLSVDYQTATGEFEAIDRGDLSKVEILDILKRVSRLTPAQEPDSCPPSVNVILSGGIYSCFYGDSGVIRCSDSKEEAMSPDVASRIINNELSIAEYDLSKGHRPTSKIGLLVFVAAIVAAVGFYIASI